MSQSPFLIRHLNGSKEGRLPVWLMRQAGRYLPAYQEIRKQHSFWQMVSKPEIAAKVSLMPLEYLKVDAVIFFSDILTLPYGMNIPIAMKESIGPVVEKPLRDVKAFEQFRNFDPKVHTPFVTEALGLIKQQLPTEITLIGFAGAPWTVGCYLVEGQGKNGFPTMIEWMKKDPRGLAECLSHLTDATIEYLKSQVRAGAHMVQLFDTWLGSMSLEFFDEHYLPLVNRITRALRDEKVYVTYFAKGAGPFLSRFQNGLAADVLGVETSLTLTQVEKATGGKFRLQGNYDPEKLFGEISTIRREARALVQEAQRLTHPTIINLGHGVMPKTPVENVQAFVEEARTLWI